MQQFTAFEYLLIDVANQFGLDKERFDSRILWAKANFDKLELLIPDAPLKTRAAYEKAVQVIRSVCAGNPTGHRIGMDAICSGMQIMSALTQCESGCRATGLISDENSERPNAYTLVADAMAHHLNGAQVVVDAADVKKAVMTSLYGSKATPRRLFGDADPQAPATPELLAFYAALKDVAPGASVLLDELLSLWQPYADKHVWVLPDGHVSSVKVMVEKEKRIRVEELNNSSMTYHWYENEGLAEGLSLVANVTHSIDAYILRSLVRRCMHDEASTKHFRQAVLDRLIARELGEEQRTAILIRKEARRLLERFEATKMADILILSHISTPELATLSTEHLEKLLAVLKTLDHAPFEIICVHDEFTAHANNLNHLRNHYRNILADLSESEILSDIFTTISGREGVYEKQSSSVDVPAMIRQANYMLS